MRDLILVMFVAAAGAGGFYLYQQHQENEQLKAKLAAVAERLPAREREQLNEFFEQHHDNEELRGTLATFVAALPQRERVQLVASKKLLPAEIPEGAPMTRYIHQHVVCTLCKGEGAVMVRRTLAYGAKLEHPLITGSVQDIRARCTLCMGSGKRDFDMPGTAEVCPDCKGMGARVVARTVGATGRTGLQDGFYNEAPTTTGCPRCLGKGYLNQPGFH